jgi:hypothetical protein
MNNFPLIYCNGDSYSDENHYPTFKNNMYPNFVAHSCEGFVLNKAIGGSCNRRIIRTTVADMIHQRQINPEQQIIALIGLSFEIRSEVWADNITKRKYPEESNFLRHHFTKQTNWRENLLNHLDIKTPIVGNFDQAFFKKYSDGRAYFFSPYAERINLYCDLIMLRSLLESLNIDFLIFQSPKAETLQAEYLLDFFKIQLKDDNRFFDFENFGFINWCYEQNFIPMDSLDKPEIGHYGIDAHESFANTILIPKLKELNIL